MIEALREELQSIEAVAFDKDGVLADSEEINFRSTHLAFAELGLAVPQGARSRIVGRHPDDFLPELATAAGLAKGRMAELKRRKGELYARMWRDEARLCAGAAEALAAFARRGRPMAICTNATSDELDAFLARFDLAGRFAVALSRDGVRRPKPAPDIYLLAAQRLGVSPERMLVVEDSVFGVSAAKAAGAVCVVVAPPGGRGEAAALADAAVDSLDELCAGLALRRAG
jgi:HAD superfamily hydrolase (TIGR01509 family)